MYSFYIWGVRRCAEKENLEWGKQVGNNRENETEIDLLQLAKALWHKAWAIVLVTLITAAMAFAGTKLFITPLYTASAMMYVNNSSISVGSTQVNLSDLTAAQSLVETYMVILKTRGTLEEVIKEANLPYDYEQLSGMIEAGAVNSTEVFSISVTSASPEEAEKIANTIAELLPNRIADIVEGSSVRIVDYAVVPSKKTSPSLSKNTMLGAVLGFMLSCGVFTVLYLLDDVVHNEDYIRVTFDLPLLAVVPDLTEKNSKSNYYYYRDDSKGGKEETA